MTMALNPAPDTPDALTPEIITLAAQTFLDTPGDQPEKEHELAWAQHLMTAALTAVYPLLQAQIASEALSTAAHDFGAGEWLDAFIQGEVVNDVTAVQATTAWFQQRANALLTQENTPDTQLVKEAQVQHLIAQIEDLIYAQTKQHVFRSGHDGSFTGVAGDLAALLLKNPITA